MQACPGKPGHKMGRLVRGAQQGGRAGLGRTRCQQNCEPRKQNLSNQKPTIHTTGGSGRRARRSGRAGSGKIRCQRNFWPCQLVNHIFKAIEETSLQRISRSTNKRNPTCQIQNPDIPRVGRVRAPGGAAGQCWARLVGNRTIRPQRRRRNVV